MRDVMLSGREMLKWNDETAERWFNFLHENPAVLALPCDIAGVTTVAQMLQHIVAVEVRYAERLLGKEATPYEAVPYGTVDELVATHGRAHSLYEQMLNAPEFAWTEEIAMVTRTAGTITASRRKVFFHAQMHGIRHYAQLATLVRQHGFKPGWPMDLMMTRGMR